jgi:hypothetical protein
MYVRLHKECIASYGNRRGFEPLYCRAAGQILTLRLHGLPVCHCDAWPAGPHINLDAQPIKDNLHNHINVS